MTKVADFEVSIERKQDELPILTLTYEQVCERWAKLWAKDPPEGHTCPTPEEWPALIAKVYEKHSLFFMYFEMALRDLRTTPEERAKREADELASHAECEAQTARMVAATGLSKDDAGWLWCLSDEARARILVDGKSIP